MAHHAVSLQQLFALLKQAIQQIHIVLTISKTKRSLIIARSTQCDYTVGIKRL